MNARKTIVILGCVALAILAVIVTVSIWKINQVEKEKNFIKTSPARAAKAAKRDEPKNENDESASDFKQEETFLIPANENS